MYTTNTVFSEARKHYVTLFMQGTIDNTTGSELQLMEPDKCVAWIWMPWSELQQKHRSGEIKVFPTLATLLEDSKFEL